MNRSLFTRIIQDLSANCPYFQEGCDTVGKAGISALVKCTSAIRQLAYAAVPDSLDEYLQIGEKTSRDWHHHNKVKTPAPLNLIYQELHFQRLASLIGKELLKDTSHLTTFPSTTSNSSSNTFGR
ncbi:hypothetical protein Tco_0696240 [Tanacetum coccineum]